MFFDGGAERHGVNRLKFEVLKIPVSSVTSPYTSIPHASPLTS